jgi:DNA polymerase-3 subunit epsilon
MKSLLFFDIESTGVEIATDRIIELAWLIPAEGIQGRLLFNPGCKIPPSATAVHGITDEMVANCPPFRQHASELLALFSRCDLAGYNIIHFDVPLLWEEFYRAGIEWNVSESFIVDACSIFKKKEQRTLSAAVRFFLGRDMQNAHSAVADTAATAEVLSAQIERYDDLAFMDRAELAKFSNDEQMVDLAGRIALKDGVPVYNFGKAKGVPVKSDPGFGMWMLRQDFISSQTKMTVRRILEGK